MNLPFFKKTPTTPAREYFFALEIDHHTVKSAVWAVANGKSQVVSMGSVTQWDDKSADSLVSASDQSLSDAANRLDPAGKIQPEKVILGLPSDWMTEEKIKHEYLRDLKQLTQKLSLTAVGFVVTSESAVRYLQVTEGVPPTAIILGLWPHHIEVTLVRLGKIDATHVVARSASVVSDLIEGLTRFSHVSMLPSRILLYDSGSNLEEVRQELLGHPWLAPQTRLSFLHFPKIDALPSDFSIKSIALAGGTEVAKSIGLISEEMVPPPPATTVEVPSSDESTPEDLGFAPTPSPVAAPPVSSVPHTPPPIVPAEADLPFDHEVVEPEVVVEQDGDPVVEAEITTTRASRRSVRLPRFSLPKLPVFALPKFGGFPLLPLVAGLVAAVVLIILFSVYWYLPKSEVSLHVTLKSLQDDLNVTVDTAVTDVNSANFVIPAQSVETEVTGDKSAPATGTKLIGDKATGTVTIINGTNSPRSFPSGTTISSPSGLKYTFDTEVQVASASGTADPNSYQPGKANVKVTATSIGTDSNLSAGTQFRVGTFATLDYVAKNDVAFAGGSSRQVKAVAKADIDKLRSELSTSLGAQAREGLLAKAGDGQTVVSDSITVANTSESLDNQAGDTADQVSLKLTLKAKGIMVTSSQLEPLVIDRLKSQVPEGYTTAGIPTYTFGVKKSDKTTVALAVHVTQQLMPQYSQDQIIRSISGKTQAWARKYLESLPEVARVDLKITPSFVSGFAPVPHVVKNINLTIVPAL